MPGLLVEQGKIIEIFPRKRLCVFSNLALDFKRKADDLFHKAMLSNGEKKNRQIFE